MKVIRPTKIDTHDYHVGDVIRFTLKSGEKVEAMAVDKQKDGMIFCLIDCLHQEYPMNQTNTNEGGWEKSLLRKTLNTSILDLFPDFIREKMKPVWKEDLLTIPSIMEIFGENRFSEEQQDGKQWKPMKDRRNRIAWQGSKTGVFEWYWLRVPVSAPHFAFVYADGGCACDSASGAWVGVRPAFKI